MVLRMRVVRQDVMVKEYFHYGCAALRVAIDIETPIVFLYLSQRAAQHYRSLSLTIARNGQRSAAVVETGL